MNFVNTTMFHPRKHSVNLMNFVNATMFRLQKRPISLSNLSRIFIFSGLLLK